jgi:hypothetical protein
VLVEEVDVEREAHAKGVDARTTGNEKPRANLVASEMGKPEQARAEAGCDRNPPAEHCRNRETTQARSKKAIHRPTSLPENDLSPTHSLTSPFFPVCGKKGELGGFAALSARRLASDEWRRLER